jgi:hypothetical protein
LSSVLVFFRGIEQLTRNYGDVSQAAREFTDNWRERGDLAAFCADKKENRR